MFGTKEGKPVTVRVVEHTYIEGELIMAGEILRDLPADVAMELASGGKIRLATEADLLAADKAAKATKAAA